MFETLANEGINIDMISTSTIRTSCIVAESDVDRAVRSLHTGLRPGLMPPRSTTARTLWLLRHAKTVADPRQAAPTSTGCWHLEVAVTPTALGQLFAGSGEGLPASSQRVPRPQVALVSPAARTTATAELVLEP